MRTVRSFCRICTTICGIVVDVDGDVVSRSVATAIIRSPRAIRARRVGRYRSCTITPTVSSTRCSGSTANCGRPPGTLPRRPRRRLRATIEEYGPQAVGIYFGTGIGMDAAGYRIAQALHPAIGTPAKFSPLTIDGTAKMLVAELMGGSPALTRRPDYDNATLVMFVGINPVVSHGHTVGLPNPRGAIRDLAERAEVWFSTLDARRPRGLPRTTSRPGRARTTPCSPTWSANCCATAQMRRCTGRRPTRRGGRAVHPGASANVADVPEASCAPAGVHPTAGTDGGRDRHRHHHGAERQCDAMAVLGSDHPHRLDEPPRRHVVPSGVRLPARAIRPPGRTGGRNVSAWPAAAARRPSPSFANGRAPCCPTRSTPETSGAFLNLGGSLVTGFPDASSLVPALKKLELFVTTEIVPTRPQRSQRMCCRPRTSSSGPTSRCGISCRPRISAQHTPAVVPPVGERRSIWWVLAEIGRRLGHDLADTGAATTRCSPHVGSGVRGGYDELTASGWAEAPIELPAQWVDATSNASAAGALRHGCSPNNSTRCGDPRRSSWCRAVN